MSWWPVMSTLAEGEGRQELFKRTLVYCLLAAPACALDLWLVIPRSAVSAIAFALAFALIMDMAALKIQRRWWA